MYVSYFYYICVLFTCNVLARGEGLTKDPSYSLQLLFDKTFYLRARHSSVSAYCRMEVRVSWHLDEEERDAEVLFLFVAY
jgi:hypothetical protein